MSSPTPPVNVNPGDIQVSASSLEALKSELGGAIPPGVQVTVFPTGAVTALIHGNVALATAVMQGRIGENSGKLNQTGQQYTDGDKQNAGKLGKEVAEDVKFGEKAQMVQAVLGPAAQGFGAITQVTGALTQAASGFVTAAAYPFSSLFSGLFGPLVSAGAQHPGGAATNGATNGGALAAPFPPEHESTGGPLNRPSLRSATTHQLRTPG
jgi:hypothetical protein